MTVNYSNNIEYDETKILAYPLKEYDRQSVMEKDLNMEYIHNITLGQLEQYRIYAHSIYEKANKEYQKREKKKSKKEDLYSHLDSVIITTNIPDYHGEMELLMTYTITQILMYYKLNEKNFSIHQLKNQAVNYLYFKGIIKEIQIINYINLKTT